MAPHSAALRSFISAWFCFLSALLHAPWGDISTAESIWEVLGLVGVVYAVAVTRRLWKQAIYRLTVEDWLFYAMLPMIAYASLALSSVVLRSLHGALFGVGTAVLLLLFTGIHNAWDSVSYHVFVHRAKTDGEQH